MAFEDWLDNTLTQVRELGPVMGPRAGVYELWEGVWRGAGKVWNYGTPIYDRDWDVLLLIDACRVDALHEVADTYDFIENIGIHTSIGSNSAEWTTKNFTGESDEKISNTVYVTANPHSRLLDSSDFEQLDEVWKYGGHEHGSVRPEVLSERIIDNYEEYEPDYLIGHYMQPHLPFRAETYPDEATVDISEDLGHGKFGVRNVYKRMRDGEVSKEAVWSAYIDNLRWVLDSIETVLGNIDAETVAISSDHSELFGEWGFYCHPENHLYPGLKRVPWVTTTASCEPDVERGSTNLQLDPENTSKLQVEDQLRDLGYLS